MLASNVFAQYEVVGGTRVVSSQVESPEPSIDEMDCVGHQGPLYNFPDEKGGLKNLWKPALCWNLYDCKLSDQHFTYERVRLLMVASDTYFRFDSDSRILIRFSDGHVSTLHRNTKFAVKQIYENTSYGIFYKTLTDFDVDEETKRHLLNPEMGVVKIRVVFTNGNARDYDLPEKYQKKFTQHMIESYVTAMKMINIKHNNNDDSNF